MPVNPKAKYEIVAEDKTAAAWKSAVKRADESGKKIGELAEIAFAGVAVGAIGEAIKKAIEFGDEIGKAATKAGVGAKQMSELAFAARMSDVDIGSLSEALKKMQVNLSQASTGNKTVTETLAALGLTLGQIKGLQADEQFELIADRISKLKDPADRARAAVELFGKAGANLLPLLTQGSEGIKAAREEAQRLGLSFDENMVKKLQEGDDALKKLSATWDGWMARVAIGAVHVGQALDLVDKDKIGEIQDALDAAKSRQDRMGDTGDLAGMRRQAEIIDSLNRQLAALTHQESGHGAIHFEGAPGFGSGLATEEDRNKKLQRGATPEYAAFEQNAQFFKQLDDEIEQHHKDMEENRLALSKSTESGIRDALEDTKTADKNAIDEYVSGIERANEKLGSMSVYAEEAARNMQDAFADFLFDPFSHGLKGMLSGFIDVIRRMIAEAAAAKIFETVFGKQDKATGSGGASGFFSAAMDAFFGGHKAEGGPIQKGKWYIAGEHGPEPIWGGGPGAYAMGYGGGGGGTTIHNYVTLTGSNTVTQDQLARALKQSNDQMAATVRNDKRRGSGAFSR
jgi:hypothetical protein